MDIEKLFPAHICTLQERYEETLTLLANQGIRIEAVLLHSGSLRSYHADDHAIPFKAHPHFLHWAPVERPDQMILVEPGKKARLFLVTPRDYWHEQDSHLPDWVAQSFDLIRLEQGSAAMEHLPPLRRMAFLGENVGFAAQLGIPSGLINERNLVNRLDFGRSLKTPYEVARLTRANRRALLGHEAARLAFEEGASEWEIHLRYLQACQLLENECPYGNIVALDEKAAILHYQNKRRSSGKNSQVLLIDAGAPDFCYGSDITRTHCRAGSHPVFLQLAKALDRLELALVERVHCGVPYQDLQEAAHEAILDLLLETGIAKGSREECREKRLSSLFFPHGIGHLLGLQVHDVSGHFKDETGVLAPPPEEHKSLRLTRKMQPDMVFTVEPGFYFIPLLLDPERTSSRGNLLNWPLIEQLLPLGGIRVEDNILVTEKGPRNLTR